MTICIKRYTFTEEFVLIHCVLFYFSQPCSNTGYLVKLPSVKSALIFLTGLCKHEWFIGLFFSPVVHRLQEDSDREGERRASDDCEVSEAELATEDG